MKILDKNDGKNLNGLSAAFFCVSIEIAAKRRKDSFRRPRGVRLGRPQAFGLMANRCSTADAECLKQMRDSGKYKEMGMTWATFCQERAGISRVSADRLINHLEEFGANYFRLSELMPISRDTYRLIAGAVSEEGVEVDGKKIPLTRENRKRVMAAVESLRGKVQTSAETI